MAAPSWTSELGDGTHAITHSCWPRVEPPSPRPPKQAEKTQERWNVPLSFPGILFDGEKHETAMSRVAYAASTYGAETVDGSGFVFAGRMTAWYGPIVVGEATATATATFDPDDPNTMTGTFAFTTELTFFEIPEAEIDEEFFFVAHKVVEGDARKVRR